jgi:uncharacterized membrane protein YphA (DoxX/SURF4 family)
MKGSARGIPTARLPGLRPSAEIVFPILLVFGLATRVAACALLVMTLVVERTMPDGWPVHVTWR